MKRLTKEICGRPHGAEGKSEEKLTGSYCRGEFEATAIVERLFAIEEILGDDYDLERLRVIVNQRMSMREKVQERFSITKNIPVDRLREIVRAEKDGRIIIKSSGRGKTCSTCEHYYPFLGRRSGECELRDKFTVNHSKHACKDYLEKVDE